MESEKALSPEELDCLEQSTKKIKAGEVADDRRKFKERSYRQSLVWGKKNEYEARTAGNIEQIAIANEEEWSDEEEMSQVEGEKLIHKVTIDKDQKRALRFPWRFSVIVKVIGRSLNFNVLQQRLFKLWNLDEETDMVDIGYGYYIVKLADKKALAWFLTGGPWKIMDHYLSLQRWKPNFQPSTETIGSMAVWVRLPELPIEYFNADLLMEIGKVLGKPIKLDANTSLATRGKFAIICNTRT